MAMLASGGIGVFVNRHAVVQSRSSVIFYKNGKGTHDFACEAVEHWWRSESGYKAVGSVVRPGGIELADWSQRLLPGMAICYWSMDRQLGH